MQYIQLLINKIVYSTKLLESTHNTVKKKSTELKGALGQHYKNTDNP